MGREDWLAIEAICIRRGGGRSTVVGRRCGFKVYIDLIPVATQKSESSAAVSRERVVPQANLLEGDASQFREGSLVGTGGTRIVGDGDRIDVNIFGKLLYDLWK